MQHDGAPAVAALESTRLKLSGLTCAACVSAVEKGLLAVTGVDACSVSLMAKACQVRYDPFMVSPPKLVHAVESLGYGAEESGSADAAADVLDLQQSTRREAQSLRRMLLGSLCFTIPVVILSMIIPMTPAKRSLQRMVAPGLSVRTLVIWILTTPVQFGFGAPFYVSAFHSLRRRAANMDVLISIGTTAAYAYSVVFIGVALATRGEQGEGMEVFETSATLISGALRAVRWGDSAGLPGTFGRKGGRDCVRASMRWARGRAPPHASSPGSGTHRTPSAV